MVDTHSLLFRQNCPICEKELIDLKSYSFIEKIWGCKNKCYSVKMHFFGLSEYEIMIFDHKIELRDPDIRYSDYEKMQEIEDNVEYWRKNQMYLTKIIGVD